MGKHLKENLNTSLIKRPLCIKTVYSIWKKLLDLQTVFTKKKIGSYHLTMKSSFDKDCYLKRHLVYESKYNGCGCIYFGPTCWLATSRIQEQHKKDSEVGQQHADFRASTNFTKLNFLTGCGTVENLMTMEATEIRTLKSELNNSGRAQYWGGNST